MLAYAGFMTGQKYVSDVMDNPDLAKLVKRHLKAAANTLDPLPGIDLETYAASLMQRFANPNIRHETYQIAMDGTEKLPQRIFQPAITALTRGHAVAPFAFATAAWMRYCLGDLDERSGYELRDPRQEKIANGLSGKESPKEIATFLFNLDGFLPDGLRSDQYWLSNVTTKLATMLDEGMLAALCREAK